MVDHAALVGALESSGLDPGVREVTLAIPAEKEHAPDGWYLASLVDRDPAQGLDVGATELAQERKQLGSGSEVQGFRAEIVVGGEDGCRGAGEAE